MTGLLLAAAVGLATGVLSGFGIGGGSLLMLWLTCVMGVGQRDAAARASAEKGPNASPGSTNAIPGRSASARRTAPRILPPVPLEP